MMLRRISHRRLAETGYLGMDQGLEEGEFSGGTKNLPTNPSPVGQAIGAERRPAPARDQLVSDVRTGQNRAGELVGIDHMEAQACKYGQGGGLAATNATREP